MEPEINVYETTKNDVISLNDSDAYRTNGMEYSKNNLTANGAFFINFSSKGLILSILHCFFRPWICE